MTKNNRDSIFMLQLLQAVMPVPFWRSDRDFIEEMEIIYKNASTYAKELFEQDFGKDKTGL